jgi:hypothetical protein
MSDEQLDRERRLAYLHGVMAVLIDEMNRIYKPDRFILWKMLEHNRGKRLLFQADAVLAEICRLEGEPHTPLPPMRRPKVIGHPLFWWYGQWAVGAMNAIGVITYTLDGQWALAVLSLACLAVCMKWRVPPYHIAKQGKWRA